MAHMNLTHFTDVAVDDGSLCLPDVFFNMTVMLTFEHLRLKRVGRKKS